MLDWMQTNPVLVSGFLASCVAVWGISTQRSISREKNSIDFESKLNSNRKYIDDLSKIAEIMNKGPAELERIASDKSEGFNEIINILNEWERCANALRRNVYDDEYVYKVFGSGVMTLYTRLQPFIIIRQEVNPRFFIQFTIMASSWMIRRHDEDSRHAHTQKLQELLKMKRECKVTLKKGDITYADHSGHIKNFKKAVKQLKKQMKV
ncbi:DUF4760 domain-containing protein [Pseudoalteromonas sp. SMN1298-MNA-CIBAN-0114]|uniref:DUF4760 domain-containing protein n=1 Tax=Pseudoalteromonas sp. SMN1298-MNA-CIBAN-0114 TaxID=3140428 RepID=UPI00332693CE